VYEGGMTGGSKGIREAGAAHRLLRGAGTRDCAAVWGEEPERGDMVNRTFDRQTPSDCPPGLSFSTEV